MNEFVDLMSNNAQQAFQGGKLFGVVIGVVTNNQDPQKMGRVKVRYPWLNEADESFWARIATTMAGAKRGTFFLPEVGDEVLLAFEHGDIRFPYVIGALWNGVDTPHEDNADGKNNLRIIRSRSGHELIFNDDDQGRKERVELHTKAGHQVVLDDSAGGEKITVKDKSGGNSIVIDSVSNAITVTSKLKMTLKSQSINIEAGTNMKIKAGGVLTIKGALVKIN